MKILVHLTPNAKKSSIEKVEDFFGNEIRKIKVTAQPINGKANKALIVLISKELGVAPSFIKIVKGDKSRKKIVEVEIDK